ncbi:iron-containing alcohol dehydrogenase [Clostridiales bacterium TF09-2AC]|nr:iron-containing alcohol dehydrogenase [Clostridiales bacterium TF09-2AC]
MAYQFYVNSDIVFGWDSVKELPGILKGYGAKKVMVVYDAGVKAAGIAEQVLAMVEETNIPYVVFDGVIPNPTNEVVEEAAGLARCNGVDVFVAVGGGSSIDLAKAIDVLMTNPGSIGDYAGIGKVRHPLFPLVAIPTTAGTSSEITNVSALTDTEKIVKYVVIDNKLVPSKVIIDPEFTRTMPASVTAATGMDAITHAVESYISNRSNPLTEYNSIKGLEILYRNITRAVMDGADMEAREQMMLGCVITGFGFSNANLGLVHAIAHTLSAHFHLAHGMANAAVLPYVMEFNADGCPEKMAELARAIGLTMSGNMEDDRYLLAGELLHLVQKLGIKTLSEQGITEQDLDMLAEEAMREPVLGFNPRQDVGKEDILAILRKAF